jgi:hypothetical protein
MMKQMMKQMMNGVVGKMVMGHGGGRAVSRMEQPKRAGSPLVPLAHKRVSKPAHEQHMSST